MTEVIVVMIIIIAIINFYIEKQLDFPGRSAGKESACNAGDSGSIPGSERSAGEGIGYLLWYSGFPYSSIFGLPLWLIW